MKKNSNRKIRDYSKYTFEQPEYYGLLVKNKRVRVDVKRMEKTLRLNTEIITEMNKPRKTVYFIPKHTDRYNYMINIFRDTINDLIDSWRNEIRPAMKNVETPKEVGDKARTGYYMQTGILDYDECSMLGFFSSMERESRYEYIMSTIIAQFIHQYVSVIESTTLRVMTLNGYKNDTFKRGEFNTFIQGYQKDSFVNIKNILMLEDLDNYNNYDRMYNVWHFLKHNSMDLYKKIQRKHPEMLYENHEYQNGQLAMGILRINTDYVNSLFKDSLAFFEELCSKVFKEDTHNANWNYDKLFIKVVDDEIESITNPLGLPPWL